MHTPEERELFDKVGGLRKNYLAAREAVSKLKQPLRRAEAMARSIADMDLTGAPQTAYANDETGRLVRVIDLMRTALQAAPACLGCAEKAAPKRTSLALACTVPLAEFNSSS